MPDRVPRTWLCWDKKRRCVPRAAKLGRVHCVGRRGEWQTCDASLPYFSTNMASTEPVEAEPEYDEMEDDMMGPLPVSKMEVRSTCSNV